MIVFSKNELVLEISSAVGIAFFKCLACHRDCGGGGGGISTCLYL